MNTAVMETKTAHRFASRHAVIATATAAEVISTRTPVAYAPACASTLARKTTVTTIVTPVKSATNGRFERAHSGAMPYRGRYRGTRFSSPAIADAPANHRISTVARS